MLKTACILFIVSPIDFSSTLADGSDYIDIIEQIYYTNGTVNDTYAVVIYTVSVRYVNKILKRIFEQFIASFMVMVRIHND